MATSKEKKWLQEGKQSKITKEIKAIAKKFTGNEFEKVRSIFLWINKNIKNAPKNQNTIKIFAKRSASKIIKDGWHTGCHDIAVIFVTLARASNIPTKYIEGIDKINPHNRGHCVAEVYISKSWMLADATKNSLYFLPTRSSFYQQNYILGIGLDSWDVGIKSFKDWKEHSQRVKRAVKRIQKT